MSNRIGDVIFESDNLLREIAPLNRSTDPPTAVSTGACVGRLFDDEKDSRVAKEFVSVTTFEVDDIRPFRVGDMIQVKQDDGAWFDMGPLVSKSGNNLTATAAPPVTVGLGRRVSVQLGEDITMPTYGTPNVNTKDWGYGGIIKDTHLGLRVGMNLRVETVIDAGTDLKSTSNYKTHVVGGT